MGFRKHDKSDRGFTIVELLIVIVVIAVLASVSIAAYNGVQQRAKVSKANSDIRTLIQAIYVARLNESKTLMQITGSGCSGCYGQATVVSSIDKIAVAAKTNLDSLKNGDPWGNYYHLDENEGENVSNPCVKDYVRLSTAQTGVPQVSVSTFAC